MIYGNKVRTWLILAVLSLNHQYTWSMEKSENVNNLTQIGAYFQSSGSNFMQLSFDQNKATLEQLKEIEEFSKKFNLEKSHPEKTIASAIRLLSLDGGGTRGYMTALYLCYLTRLTQKPIHELFDVISVTSTGTILGLAFGTKRPEDVPVPKVLFNIPNDEAVSSLLSILNTEPPASPYYTPDDMILMYQQESPLIFTKKGTFEYGATYTDKYLNDILKKYFGTMTLSDLAISTYITAHEVQTGMTDVYSRYEARINDKRNFPLTTITRAAVAAPTYFDPIEVDGKSMCDGGIDFNNPAPLALCRVAQEFRVSFQQILTISISAGNRSMHKPHTEYAAFGQIAWGWDLLDRVFSGKDGHQMMLDIYSTQVKFDDLKNHYFRISPEIHKDLFKTDKTDKKFFEDLEQISYQEMYKLKHEFAHFASLLVTQDFEAESLPVPQTPLVPRRHPTNVNSSSKSQDQGLQIDKNEKKGKKKEGTRKRSKSNII